MKIASTNAGRLILAECTKNPSMYFLDGYPLDNVGRHQEAAILYRRNLEARARNQAAITAQNWLAAIQ